MLLANGSCCQPTMSPKVPAVDLVGVVWCRVKALFMASVGVSNAEWKGSGTNGWEEVTLLERVGLGGLTGKKESEF